MSQLSIGGMGKDADLKKMQSYLMMLTEQLRFVLGNIEPENLSPTVVQVIEGARDAVNSKVGTDDETYTKTIRDAKKIGWIVAGGDSESTMVLTDKVFQLVSANIDLTGKVTFSSLDGNTQDAISSAANNAANAQETASSLQHGLTNGTTVIDGGCIRTGYISAARIDTNGLQVTGLSSGDYEMRMSGSGIQFSNDMGHIGTIDIGYRTFDIGAQWYLNLHAPASVVLSSDPGGYASVAVDGKGLTVNSGGVTIDGHLRPSTAASLYSLGTRGGEGEFRFKNVNITGSVDSSSDRRVKRDIADLDAGELLSLLRPRRFRMIADGETGKTRWGFIAQEVAEALGQVGISDVELYNDDNPEHLSLCYTELIAPLVAGYQALEARLSALEGKT